MTVWRFHVDGVPVSQGSASPVNHRHTGKAVFRHSNEARLAPWRADVAEAARRAGVACIEGPVRLAAVFTFARPKSHHGKRGILPSAPATHTQTPDLDKLVRAVGDALEGIAYTRDSQIVALDVAKEWGDQAGALIHLSTVGGLELDPGEKHQSGTGENGNPAGELEAPTHTQEVSP
jgi:crossover junction endodeoxyribonuclease RusA